MDMGIPVKICTITDPPPSTGVQEWARQKRYQHLWQEASALSAVVVTGHHADDQAETVQMRLSRGSGLRGLGGMRICQSFQGVRLIRPFLDTPGEMLRRYGISRGLASVDDPSNRDIRFERVRLRQYTADLAGYGFGRDNFNRLAAASRRLTDRFDDVLWGVAADAAGNLVSFDAGGWASIDQSKFVVLPKSVAGYLLRRIATEMNIKEHPPKNTAAEGLATWIKTTTDGKKTLAGLEWQVKSGRIWVFPEAECYPVPQTALQGMVVYDHRWVIDLPCGGQLAALGERRCAMLRRQYPKFFTKTDTPADVPANAQAKVTVRVPVRAYWRWPVFTPDAAASKNIDGFAQKGFISLEDGAIIPHLSKTSLLAVDDRILSSGDSVCAGLRMKWTSKDELTLKSGQTERHHP
jgi:tRNA(Ile)-lysidine synthase